MDSNIYVNFNRISYKSRFRQISVDIFIHVRVHTSQQFIRKKNIQFSYKSPLTTIFIKIKILLYFLWLYMTKYYWITYAFGIFPRFNSFLSSLNFATNFSMNLRMTASLAVPRAFSMGGQVLESAFPRTLLRRGQLLLLVLSSFFDRLHTELLKSLIFSVIVWIMRLQMSLLAFSSASPIRLQKLPLASCSSKT